MKAAVRILHSFCFISYLEDEEGAEKMVEVFRAARDSGRDLLLSAVNWGEVHHLTLRKAGCERAEQEAGFSAAQNFPPWGCTTALSRQNGGDRPGI